MFVFFILSKPKLIASDQKPFVDHDQNWIKNKQKIDKIKTP